MRRFWTLVLPASLLLVVLSCSKTAEEEPPHSKGGGVRSAAGPLEAGRPAPLLQVEKLLQAPPGAVASWEALRGKAVVLEFWATWCGPCVAAVPHLNELADEFAGKPVQFIAITAENQDVVDRFLAKKPIHAWVGLDTDKSMQKDYGVEGIPLTVLVDARGVLAGITYPTDLTAQVLEDLLAGRPLVKSP